MKQNQFQRLKEVDTQEDFDGLELGDFFLYGKAVVAQKQNKTPGQEISYYQVVGKQGSSVEYAPVFDTLEKSDKEDN